MKSIILKSLLIILVIINHQASANDEFTGDLKLSCEAVLCLSSGSPPGECNPALNRYYSINYKSFSKTIRKRIEFLNICPVSSESPQMQSLVNAIANGAGRCDAASLNTTLREWIPIEGQTYGEGYFCIKNQLPDYCRAYTNHEYTDLKNSVTYVIDPPEQQYNPFNSQSYIRNNWTDQSIRQCGHWVN